MNDKEISEIRRRFKPERNNIALIRGCYVNEKREIVTSFNLSPAMMPQEEAEKYLLLLKKSLSGTQGKNLIDIAFLTSQVADSDEHRLLTALKDSMLKDENAVQAFFSRAIESLSLEGNYLILLSCDKYDVPYRSRGGERIDDASSEMFTYIVCSICPVKESKPALSYSDFDGEFHSRMAQWVVSAPEIGFMFPSFDDRATNIYNALYYTRDTAENHREFTDIIFNTELPMPAAEQKETFQSILADTLDDECSLNVIQNVHDSLRTMITEHKLSREPEPLKISKYDVKGVLESCGVSDERLTSFEEKFDESFGDDADISPRNIVDISKLEMQLPDVIIKVKPDRSDLIETRVINGSKYILIRANEGVEVNGVNICIDATESSNE